MATGITSSSHRLNSLFHYGYIIIPTADSLGSITIALERLWRNEIIPERSIPFVIPVQDLHLMAELLPTPLEVVAYLDYREELLAHEDIFVVDEKGILGSFVGGIDVLAKIAEKTERYEFQFLQPGWKNSHQLFFLGSDYQEQYLNPWIYASHQAWLSQDMASSPPRRHSMIVFKSIENLFDATGDIAAASIALQVSRETLAVSLLCKRAVDPG